MHINHYETCGKCHGVHFDALEHVCVIHKPELIEQPRIIGNFGIELHFGSNSPDDLRKLGYSVAVHKDYKMHGIDSTFWLFTN